MRECRRWLLLIAPVTLPAGARGFADPEPPGGFGAACRMIGKARHSIDLTMYELEDTGA